jgi:hypothetical protein
MVRVPAASSSIVGEHQMKSLAYLDPELETVKVIVQSEPLKGSIDKYFTWNIIGREEIDVEREVERIKVLHTKSFCQFTSPTRVPDGGTLAGWYFAMGVTYSDS